jgi:hypothetical protein
LFVEMSGHPKFQLGQIVAREMPLLPIRIVLQTMPYNLIAAMLGDVVVPR